MIKIKEDPNVDLDRKSSTQKIQLKTTSYKHKQLDINKVFASYKKICTIRKQLINEVIHNLFLWITMLMKLCSLMNMDDDKRFINNHCKVTRYVLVMGRFNH